MPRLKKILFVCPYPHGKSPSQRFRFEQYLSYLKNTFTIEQHSFIDITTWNILYVQGYYIQKTIGITIGFIKRCLLLFKVPSFDFIFIHREASPIGPPIFEWIIAKVLKKKIIYDFDDAIWLPNTSHENKIVASIKNHSKVNSICKWSYRISCGNKFLQDYAKQYNSSTTLIPTTIDTSYHSPSHIKKEQSPMIIGWTGTHSTEKYLSILVPILKELEKSHDFTFRVISNHNPDLPLKKFEFIKWKKDSEIQDLSSFDIGVMPLTDDKWAQGKCGFKALQYMSLGIPTVMSPVGVNNEIVQDNINGFLANSTAAWEEKLTLLIEDEIKRKEIGEGGLKRLTAHYSVSANQDKYLSLFN